MQPTSSSNQQIVVATRSERLHTRVVTVFTLLAIAPLVVGAILSLVASIWLTRTEAAEAQQQTAQLIGNIVSERWNATIENQRTAAQTIGQNTSDDLPTMDVLRQSCGVCRTITFIDRLGRVQEQIGAPMPASALDSALLSRIQQGQEFVATTPLFDQSTAYLVLSFPIHSGTLVRGALVTLLDVQQLGAQALHAFISDRGNYAYIVDPSGRLIASPRPAETVLGSDLSSFPAVAAALNNRPWSPPNSQIYIGLLSYRVDGAWARMPSTGWFVLVEAPRSITNTSNWYFFALQSLLLLFTIVAAVVLGRQLAATITYPIEQLQRGVLRLRSGEWQQPLAVGRRDEIGQLAEAFNSMASDLEAKQRELKRRGDELALANHELQQALEAARLANTLKSQFVATISHELRTPLTGVLGYADMLGLGVYGDLGDEQRDVVQRIYQNGEHLLQLINDLLDFSKLEAGKLDLQIAYFDLSELVTASMAICAPQAQARGLQLTSWIDPALPVHLRGDELRLRQILLNLLSNAVKFTERGSISMRIGFMEREILGEAGDNLDCAAHPAWLQIEVSDSGIGIAPADRELIFDAFRQIDGSYSRQREGTGLGLSITRRLVELMGGTIVVQSVLGQGSQFIVILPLILADRAHS
jgi:signal transduction histidine kinase